MSDAIDYYFSLISPYAYLGHDALHAMARETGATVRYRPARIFDVFDANGGVPLAKRAPARQRYRLLELQRWRAHRGLTLNLAPRHYPVDPSLADRCAIALVAAGGDADGFARDVFRALWADERDIADPALLHETLAAHGADADAVLAAARADASDAIYRLNTDAAIAADLPGLPGYVWRGETFWGQDRIDALREAIVSGRAPYAAV